MPSNGFCKVVRALAVQASPHGLLALSVLQHVSARASAIGQSVSQERLLEALNPQRKSMAIVTKLFQRQAPLRARSASPRSRLAEHDANLLSVDIFWWQVMVSSRLPSRWLKTP